MIVTHFSPDNSTHTVCGRHCRDVFEYSPDVMSVTCGSCRRTAEWRIIHQSEMEQRVHFSAALFTTRAACGTPIRVAPSSSIPHLTSCEDCRATDAWRSESQDPVWEADPASHRRELIHKYAFSKSTHVIPCAPLVVRAKRSVTL